MYFSTSKAICKGKNCHYFCNFVVYHCLPAIKSAMKTSAFSGENSDGTKDASGDKNLNDQIISVFHQCFC